jgi:hypothetical protein
MAKIISERRAVELIRDRGRCLAQMNTVHGPKWFIVPGGEVSAETANRIRGMRRARGYTADTTSGNSSPAPSRTAALVRPR